MTEQLKDLARDLASRGVAISAILLVVIGGFGYLLYQAQENDAAERKRLLATISKQQEDLMERVVTTMVSLKEIGNRNTSLLLEHKARANDLVPRLNLLMEELGKLRNHAKARKR